MNKGDLIYIPSSVKLTSDDNIPIRVHTTEKPLHYLVIESLDRGWLRVYHKGSSWRVKSSDVYEVAV